MKITEAIDATHPVYVGVKARTVKRKDRSGRLWYLITARGHYFLVRSDKSAYKEVNRAFADKWEDWQPQTDQEARRESAFMNSHRGLGLRNVILGLVMGPLPENMQAPDVLPEGW